MKIHPTKKSPVLNWFSAKFYQTLKEELMSLLLNVPVFLHLKWQIEIIASGTAVPVFLLCQQSNKTSFSIFSNHVLIIGLASNTIQDTRTEISVTDLVLQWDPKAVPASAFLGRPGFSKNLLSGWGCKANLFIVKGRRVRRQVSLTWVEPKNLFLWVKRRD